MTRITYFVRKLMVQVLISSPADGREIDKAFAPYDLQWHADINEWVARDLLPREFMRASQQLWGKGYRIDMNSENEIGEVVLTKVVSRRKSGNRSKRH